MRMVHLLLLLRQCCRVMVILLLLRLTPRSLVQLPVLVPLWLARYLAPSTPHRLARCLHPQMRPCSRSLLRYQPRQSVGSRERGRAKGKARASRRLRWGLPSVLCMPLPLAVARH